MNKYTTTKSSAFPLLERMADSKETNKHLLVAAIDFGTTFSGYAYQFKHDYASFPGKVFARNWNDGSNISTKTPTTVLIRPSGSKLEAFGYEAETRFAELAAENKHRAWYYFKHFKMMLFHSQTVELGMEIEALNGRKLSALLVFSLAIGYLKDALLSTCQNQLSGAILEHDVMWVLTVPAIWNDGAKQFMREAAMKAGINGDNLMIALEPEAAAVYCNQPSSDRSSKDGKPTSKTLPSGTKYAILDAGGDVLPCGNLREVHQPTGSSWAGKTVDHGFEKFLREIVGKQVLQLFRKRHLDDYLAVLRSFEVKKRDISMARERPIIISLPVSLTDLYKDQTDKELAESLADSSFSETVHIPKGNKMRVEASVIRRFFEYSINNILWMLNQVMSDQRVEGCETILMVGGYSESELLKEKMQTKFPHINIIIPEQPSMAVLKGAVMYGRNPQVIASRVCKYTYGVAVNVPFNADVHPESKMFLDHDGTKMAFGIFNKIVRAGQDVVPNKPYFGRPVGKPVSGRTTACLPLMASTESDPVFNDDESCFEVGEFFVDLKDKNGSVSGFTPVLRFGGTEIDVRAVLHTTGEHRSTEFLLPK